MAEVSPEHQSAGLRWLAAHADQVRKRCVVAVRRARRRGLCYGQDADDVWCYVSERVGTMHRCYRVERGVKLDTHMFSSVNWYAWKAATRRPKARRLTPVDMSTLFTLDETGDRERHEEVRSVLAGLDEEQQLLLTLRHLAGLSHYQMADLVGLSRTYVRRRTMAAEVALEAAAACRRPCAWREMIVVAAREALRECS